jgi:curli biogenesis system outer membrane secretion channel CsgG
MTTNRLFLAQWWWLSVLLWACAAGSPDVPRQTVPVRWSVAVFDFENLSPLNTADQDLTELLTAKAIETIEEAGRYDVVERQHLTTVLEELNLGSSMIADRQTQLKLGAITGARLMVFGSYQLIDKRLRLDIRLVDVQSGRVINAESHVATEPALAGWLDAVAKTTAALFQH